MALVGEIGIPPIGRPPSGLDVILSRHAPDQTYAQLDEAARRNLSSTGSTSVQAVAVVGDLRLSGFVLREAVTPSLYARFIVAFTEAVRALSADNGGWFDKFTGDGFLAFWLYPDERHLPADVISDFCQSVLPASEHLVTNLRRNSRNFPVGVGLALGLDAGPCELVRIGDAITVVGSPVVGATRMASGARAGEAIVNIHLGDLLHVDPRPLSSRGLALERAVVKTKEYPEGQEAFRLELNRERRTPPSEP
jgi:class 3 adenylate cyclase